MKMQKQRLFLVFGFFSEGLPWKRPKCDENAS
jgi:hypothetical protein